MDGALALELVMSKLSAAKADKPGAKPSPKTDKGKDFELWKAWKDGGEKPKDLMPLLKHFNSRIESWARRFYTTEIPQSSIKAAHQNAALQQFKSFDPKFGVALDTHVTNGLKRRPKRFIIRNQNSVRIRDEQLAERIGDFNRLKADLSEKRGFEPDSQTIHDYLLKEDHPYEKLRKLSLAEIVRLNKGPGSSEISTGLGLDTATAGSYSSRTQEVALAIVPHLTKEELAVHELTLGLNGKKALKPGQIAKKLGFSGPKVSNLRKSIREKMSPYLGSE